MSSATDRRRSRFLKALAARGMSQSAWARENGISKTQLSLVLNDKRESAKLTDKIDAFISEQLETQTARVA